jgi:hypothetical protein
MDQLAYKVAENALVQEEHVLAFYEILLRDFLEQSEFQSISINHLDNSVVLGSIDVNKPYDKFERYLELDNPLRITIFTTATDILVKDKQIEIFL